MTTKLKFARIRPVTAPRRANIGDAGIDFFVPNTFEGIRLAHGESVLIASGVKVDVPLGWALVFFNKSGVASKKKLDVLACVVDHGYQGEVHLNVINNGQHDVIIEPGDKLVQGILLPVGLHGLQESEPEDMWQDAIGDRGAGGFGSTGV